MKSTLTLKQTKTTLENIEIIGDAKNFNVDLDEISNDSGVQIFQLKLTAEVPSELPVLSLRWKFPAHNVKGVWSTNALHEKRLRADWEEPTVESRVSVDAPIICLYGHEDENIQTFACADVINTLQMEAPIREEDNLIYCQVKFFTEKMAPTDSYETQIRIDNRQQNFSKSIQAVGAWWETFESLQPMEVFEACKLPLYSTWYSYHQNITVEGLLEECRLSSKLGYQVIIVDDGWQTKDNNRGYDFTGDWQPDRTPNMKEFVAGVHGIGMKFMLWYSVPFCGVKSKAYQTFKGKFLTENHRWAPVFDPRYPEVREYLIDIYATALRDWNMDGFKLDFIDDFKIYPETVLTKENGRDYASVNAAVDRLMSDVAKTLIEIKPAILIEFRQKYIGPAMRKYGNMFRAFDAPNDSLTNRIRITDVKLLCGKTVVHSDMMEWHYDEPVELGALQFVNILFSVPQLSVRMAEVSEEYRQMIGFYTNYWMEKRAVLMDGEFVACKPSSNYPILKSSKGDQIIYGVYEDMMVNCESSFSKIDFINGKRTEKIHVTFDHEIGNCLVTIYNCKGIVIKKSELEIKEQIYDFDVPASGLITIEKTASLTEDRSFAALSDRGQTDD